MALSLLDWLFVHFIRFAGSRGASNWPWRWNGMGWNGRLELESEWANLSGGREESTTIDLDKCYMGYEDINIKKFRAQPWQYGNTKHILSLPDWLIFLFCHGLKNLTHFQSYQNLDFQSYSSLVVKMWYYWDLFLHSKLWPTTLNEVLSRSYCMFLRYIWNEKDPMLPWLGRAKQAYTSRLGELMCVKRLLKWVIHQLLET